MIRMSSIITYKTNLTKCLSTYTDEDYNTIICECSNKPIWSSFVSVVGQNIPIIHIDENIIDAMIELSGTIIINNESVSFIYYYQDKAWVIPLKENIYSTKSINEISTALEIWNNIMDKMQHNIAELLKFHNVTPVFPRVA